MFRVARAALHVLLRMKSAGVATILVHHAGKGGANYRRSSKLDATFEVVAGLTHHCDIFETNNNSWRVKNRS